MHRPGDIIDERYLLVKLLGVRGTAQMWEAEHEVVGRKVTLKLLSGDVSADPGLQTALVGEARAAAQIGHPTVVEVFDVGLTAEGHAYLVAEPLHGETLADLTIRRGTLRAPDACHIALQVLAGLEAAHAAGIVHGRLRPDRVVLRRDRTEQLVVKVLDFRVLPAFDDGDFARDEAMPDREPLSEYSAPEQATDPNASSQSDLFTVGAMLYTMLAGKAPFTLETAPAIVQGLVDRASISALCPGIAAGLAQIVERALELAPANRFGSAREMIDALTPYTVSEGALGVALRNSTFPLLSSEARRTRGMARLERAVLGERGEPRAEPLGVDPAPSQEYAIRPRGDVLIREHPPDWGARERLEALLREHGHLDDDKDSPLPPPPRAPRLEGARRERPSSIPAAVRRRAGAKVRARALASRGRANSIHRTFLFPSRAWVARWATSLFVVAALFTGALIAHLFRL